MTPLLLAGAALGAGGASETVLQVRHDLFGEAIFPAWELLSVEAEAGGQRIDGYLGMEWENGLGDEADPDLYALTVRGERGPLGWTAGRQQAVGERRLQSFDGARLDAALGRVGLAGWGGYARRQDLDDLADGTGIGRMEATVAAGPFRGRAGGGIEGEVLRQDAGAHVAFARALFEPEAEAWVAFASPGGVIESAGGAAAVSPFGHLRVRAHGAHREAVDPRALLGAAILDAFAPEGVDEVGVGLRAPTARWASFSASWTLSTFLEGDARRYGHTVTAAHEPPRNDAFVALSPGYRFQAGPGGVYHAALASARFDLGDSTELIVRGAVVPYQKLREPWDTAADGGLVLSQRFARFVAADAMVEAAHDAAFSRDVRGGLVLRLEGP